MKKFLDCVLNVDVEDPEDFRKRRLLNILLLGALAIMLLNVGVILYLYIVLGKDLAFQLLTGMGIFFLGIIVTYVINRRSGRWAAFLFLLILTMSINLADDPYQLANGYSTFAYTIPIAASSLILFPSASFIFTALSAASLFVLAPLAVPPTEPNIFAIVGFFTLALISWIAAHSLDRALRDLRNVNRNLDRLVDQKTRELAETLSRELIAAGRNQSILNSIADGVIVFDENNFSILANPALSRLLEIPPDRTVGCALTDFMRNESLASARADLQSLLANPEESITGVRIVCKERTLSASIARVHDARDKSMGSVAVFRDVTHEAELEKMKDTFLGVVSHELRTPLNAVLGYAEMLKEGVYGAVNEQQSNIAQRMMANAQRLLALVSDLLDQTQIQLGKFKIQITPFKPVELLESLRDVMERDAFKKGIGFETELDPSMPPTLMSDPRRLQQMMINLSSNAVKFTEAGSVNVKISRLNADYWQIRVSDTGGGIPEEARGYIFETFRQVEGSAIRKHGGIGLGLSIVKQLAELMNGNIAVESEIGKGSSFIVTLPIVLNRDPQAALIRSPQEESWTNPSP